MPSENAPSLNYRLYLLDRGFKERSNLIKNIEQAQDFYNGNQYSTPNRKNMVRVTMNICSFSTNLKAAKVVGTPTYITFTADDGKADCTKLQRFDEYNRGKLNETTEDFRSALNGFNNGTEIAYYRWDEDDSTYKGIYKGGLCLSHVDPRNFGVANPYVEDIQNQKWVMFWADYEVSAVKAMLSGFEGEEKRRRESLIEADSSDHSESDRDEESINHSLVTVYTRFFRIRGEVFFMCSTKSADLFRLPHALSPDADRRLAERAEEERRKKEEEGSPDEKNPDYGIDPEDACMQLLEPSEYGEREYERDKDRFYLYPFATFAPFAINGSFFGRSDVTQLIPIQKGINFGISMMLQCAQNNAYGKIFAKEGALRGQVITNEPGQVIVDHSRYANGWGIKLAESQPMPNGLLDFTSGLLSMARLVYGFNDVMDGSISNKDISGYAVQQMIKQANSSIEQQMKLFWKFQKDKAAVRLMFYRHFVDRARFAYEVEDHQVRDNEDARRALRKRQDDLAAKGKSLEVGEVDLSRPVEKRRVGEFRKEDIAGVSFDIGIDVMQGLSDSKLAESQMWDTLIMNGGIQNLEPEMLELYLEANPLVSQRTKATLKSVVERQKRSQLQQCRTMLSEQNRALRQLADYAKQLEAKSGYQSEYLKNLEAEFARKIRVANKVIGSFGAPAPARAEPAQAVTEGEGKSLNARGIGGTDIGSGGTSA